LGGEERPDAWLLEQLWRERVGEGLDLVGELAFLDGQLLHAASYRAQREQDAAQFRVVALFWPHARETREEPCPGQRPQLGPERYGCGDEQVTELAEPGPFRGRRSLTGSHQGP
jgi:hypothetical protein